jgi:hypothetical protein
MAEAAIVPSLATHSTYSVESTESTRLELTMVQLATTRENEIQKQIH